MKHLHFDIEKDGFYGAYWKCKNKTDAGVIAMLGDDPEDYLAKKCVKWLKKPNKGATSHGEPNFSRNPHYNTDFDGDVIARMWLRRFGAGL